MDKNATFEDTLQAHGNLIYPNVGTSMLPLLRQGKDLMVIRKKEDSRCRKYDAVLYKRPQDGKYILHRILEVRSNDYVIAGDHNYRKEYGITDRNIIGVLTAVIRNGKHELSVDSFSYRIYVHLWCDFFPVRAAMLRLNEAALRLGSRIKRKLLPGKKKDV